MRLTRAFSLSVLCLLQAVWSHANETALHSHPSQEALLKGLVSTNAVPFEAMAGLYNQREDLIQKLMNVLNGSYTTNVKADVAAVLGEYRAIEAVPFLVEHLDWDDQNRLIMRLPRSKDVLDSISWPISIALQKIGQPAIPSLYKKAAQTEDQAIVNKCVSICQSIEGPEVTRFRLQRLLEGELDSKTKERIRGGLETLTKQKND